MATEATKLDLGKGPLIQKQKEKPSLELMRKRDAELVKGVFRFFEVPGGCISFNYHAYKGDKVEKYTLIDGKIYEIPRGVARHLNNNCWWPEYGYIPGEKGFSGYSDNAAPSYLRVEKKVRRCSFQSLDYMDADSDMTPNTSSLVTVSMA